MDIQKSAILILLCSVALGTLATAQQTAGARPKRTVKLQRYMTDIPQPIPGELKLPDAPKTSRDVTCFRSFTSKATMVEVVRKCGIPDEHQGSGIFIFIYDMSDGSVVAVGTGNLKSLLYIDHITKRGGSHLLSISGPGAA